MSDMVNSVVNNLADRLGEVIEMTGPAVKSVGTISQTVVQETANAGFVYTTIGLGICGLAAICAGVIMYIVPFMRKEIDRTTTTVLMTVGMIVFLFVGLIMTLSNLQCWIAPTRHVLREVMRHIN